MTTLYIRTPAKADGEDANCPFALVGDGGDIMQQGASPLSALAETIAAARRVVLMLAASEVTLVHVSAPPLSGAKLKAALPGLVEEQLLADPQDCVLVAAPTPSTDGMRTIACVQRSWFESLAKQVLEAGARSIAAVPFQLCLPLPVGGAAAAIGPHEVVLRTGLYEGVGIAMEAAPADALASARALAGEAPLTVYVPASLHGTLALPADTTLEVETWPQLVAGSKSTTLDLVPALGSAGARQRDWARWRWPIRFAALALIVNIAGLNIEWLRMKRESDAVRQAMTQTFKAAYPNEPIQDAVAQMRRNLATAKANSGQLSPDEFTYQAAALGDALRSSARKPPLTGLEFGNGGLTAKLKPDAIDDALRQQVRDALAARGLTLNEVAAGTWQIRSAGGKP